MVNTVVNKSGGLVMIKNKSVLYLEDKVINHRKKLNSIAEIGLEEYKTSRYIKGYLESINVTYETYLQTAIVGKIKGKLGNKTIAFRADIDGLNSDDKTLHLCGHDGHMSILLGLIEYINDNKENLNDDIVFIFQPAEEGPGGALPLIKEKIFEKYNIDEIYGLHIYPELNEGYVGVRPNYFLAQTGELDIDIVGKSGHGAMPQNSTDSIIIASSFLSSLQTIVSRNVGPIDNAVVTIGKMVGGVRRNIIAENVRLEGTIRAFKPEVYNKIKERINTLAKGFEYGYYCKINVNIKDDYPAVNNDEILYEEFVNAIGKENIAILDPLMISEDFSYYQNVVPGLFFMLGSRNEEKGYINGLHNINFNFDENILLNGIDTYVTLLEYKNSIKK
jgi:N-acetyldiaminopimelate deacetylase